MSTNAMCENARKTILHNMTAVYESVKNALHFEKVLIWLPLFHRLTGLPVAALILFFVKNNNGHWSVVSGQWSVVSGQWSALYYSKFVY